MEESSELSSNIYLSLGFHLSGGGNNALLQKDVYNALIVKSRNDDSKFQCIEGSAKGESIVDLLYGDFQLLFEVRKLFQNMPLSTYGQFTQLDIASRQMLAYNYPTGQEWKNISKFASTGPASQDKSTR